jgi:UDP-N-acetylmuramate dehydrogenase
VITRELILQLQKIAAPGRVREKEILAGHSSFRTGGPADLFIEVCDREELMKVMDLLAQSQTEVFLLGRGTNLLIGDGGYRGAVVTMCAPAGTETALNRVEVDGTMLRAGAGASLLKIAMAARDAGLAGFEFAAGIPGSLGGALAVGDGHLTWDVQSITSTFFSPATSSFTIGGTCSVFRYTFDENGALTGQEDTGETVPYRR